MTKINFHKTIKDHIKDINHLIISKPVRNKAKEIFKTLNTIICPSTNTKDSLLKALGLTNPVNELTKELVLTPSAYETAVRHLRADVKAFTQLITMENPLEAIMTYLGIDPETSHVALDKLTKSICFIKNTAIPRATELISIFSEELAETLENDPKEVYAQFKLWLSDTNNLIIFISCIIGIIIIIISLCVCLCMCCKKIYQKCCKRKPRSPSVSRKVVNPTKRRVSFRGLSRNNSDGNIYELPRIFRRSSSVNTLPSPTPFRKNED